MGANTPEISVIIVSYNVWSYLRPCIVSILSQAGVTTEIVVVDNNSSDGSVEFIQKEFKEVKLIANKENKGFSAANNQGISASKGQYVLLLNPDTELKQTNCLLELCKVVDTDNKGGIVAPRLLNTDGSFQKSYWKIIGIGELLLELFYLHHLFSGEAMPDKAIYVEAVSGAAVFCERSLFDKVGLLDENMFWMEDIDLCYRVKKAGGHILYDPAIEVIHHGGKSSTNYSVVIPNQVISKLKFYKKHGSGLQYVGMSILSLAFILSRLCMFAILSLMFNSKFAEKRKAYAGALRGYLKYTFTGNYNRF
jgi:GT2 family glycosyltransferase